MNIEDRMQNALDSYKYQIGQTVSLTAGFRFSNTIPSSFEIVALMPTNGAHVQYRIRNSDEKFERVAAENELSPVERADAQ